MSDASPFQRALRDELLAAAQRRPPRRRWSLAVGAVAAAVAAVVATLSFVGTSPASAEVKVTIKDGRVEVLLTDLSSTPQDVAKAVEKAGLDARVLSRPAGPSNAGRFVGVSLSEGTSSIERIDEGVNSFMGFSLPQGWPGTLEIDLGRPAHSGEPYSVSSDAFAKKEPLSCSGLLGRTLEAAATDLSKLRVRVQPLSNDSLVLPIELTHDVIDQFGAWHIVKGFAFSPHDVLLQLQPDAPSKPLEDPGC